MFIFLQSLRALQCVSKDALEKLCSVTISNHLWDSFSGAMKSAWEVLKTRKLEIYYDVINLQDGGKRTTV